MLTLPDNRLWLYARRKGLPRSCRLSLFSRKHQQKYSARGKIKVTPQTLRQTVSKARPPTYLSSASRSLNAFRIECCRTGSIYRIYLTKGKRKKDAMRTEWWVSSIFKRSSYLARADNKRIRIHWVTASRSVLQSNFRTRLPHGQAML
jgi:hypothetical protein